MPSHDSEPVLRATSLVEQPFNGGETLSKIEDVDKAEVQVDIGKPGYAPIWVSVTVANLQAAHEMFRDYMDTHGGLFATGVERMVINLMAQAISKGQTDRGNLFRYAHENVSVGGKGWTS